MYVLLNSFRKLFIVYFISLFTIPIISQSNDAKLEIVQLSSIVDSTLQEIPWIGNDISSLFNLPPLFSIYSNNTETSAKGWIGINKDKIIIRIVVNDDYHINKQTGTNIWDGDAIQIGIDAKGDGTNGQAKDVAYTGPDDASITVALTDDGAKAWAHYYGHPDGSGAFTKLDLDIRRNDEKNITIYNILLPWESFQMKAGISPYMGLAFQINDTDKGPEQERIYWGRGAGGNLRPGLFKQLLIGDPNEEFVSIQSIKNEIWTTNDIAKAIVAVNSTTPLKISADFKNINHTIDFPGSQNSTCLQRFVINVQPGELIKDSEELTISVTGKNQNRIDKKVKLVSPGNVYDEFENKINRLIESSPHELYTRYLVSLNAIIADEKNKALSLLGDDPVHIVRFHKYVDEIVAGIENNSWSRIVDSKSSLLLSFISGIDRSLQFYTLTLPTNWNENKTYPLIVDLHGSGSAYPLDYFIELFRDTNNNSTENNVEAIILRPWGRGNLEYLDYAESDVWDAIVEVKKLFKVNEDRKYLTGGSMGGFGTWTLSVCAPDKWAAIAIRSGGEEDMPSELGFAANIAKLPILIWHGENDGAVSVTHAYKMEKALKKVGNEPKMVIVQNRGHFEQPEDIKSTYEWLLSHKRKEATKFTYLASSKRHNGRNGVTVLDIKNVIAELPKIDVVITGNIIEIKSKSTSKIKVKMGKDGLGLNGEVKVVWNGEQVYDGSVTEKVFIEKK
ncbi:MAG: prolyl oligopeptidase family serine peptidase [Bacteroidota bacterium]